MFIADERFFHWVFLGLQLLRSQSRTRSRPGFAFGIKPVEAAESCDRPGTGRLLYRDLRQRSQARLAYGYTMRLGQRFQTAGEALSNGFELELFAGTVQLAKDHRRFTGGVF